MGEKKKKQPARRARSPEAKAAQRERILAAARSVLGEEGFLLFTLDKLAARCALSKTSLYLHYETREEILLSILQEDFASWFALMRGYLAGTEQPFGPGFTEAWIASVSAQPRLAQGMVFVHSFLEPNVSRAFALEWKRFLLKELRGLHYALLESFEPRPPFELFAGFMALLTGVTTGLHQQGSPGPVISEIYEEHAELAVFRTDPGVALRVAIPALLASEAFRPLAAIRRS